MQHTHLEAEHLDRECLSYLETNVSEGKMLKIVNVIHQLNCRVCCYNQTSQMALISINQISLLSYSVKHISHFPNVMPLIIQAHNSLT